MQIQLQHKCYRVSFKVNEEPYAHMLGLRLAHKLEQHNFKVLGSGLEEDKFLEEDVFYTTVQVPARVSQEYVAETLRFIATYGISPLD